MEGIDGAQAYSGGGETIPSDSSDSDEETSGTRGGGRLDDIRTSNSHSAVREREEEYAPSILFIGFDLGEPHGSSYVRPGHPRSGSWQSFGKTTMGARSYAVTECVV